MLRQVQETTHLGIIHPYRIDTTDNPADVFTKALPVMPFWRLTTKIMGDDLAVHSHTDFRIRALEQETSGGSVKQLNIEQKEKAAKEKQIYQAEKEERKREEMAGKRLLTAANIAVTSLMTKLLDSGLLGQIQGQEIFTGKTATSPT